jgi:hypothetical protein
MAPMALALFIAGIVIHLVGYVWLVFLAYQEAPKAGRIAIWIWPLGLLVPLLRWDEVVLKALILAVVGLAMAWGGDHLMPEPPPQADPLKGLTLPQ